MGKNKQVSVDVFDNDVLTAAEFAAAKLMSAIVDLKSDVNNIEYVAAKHGFRVKTLISALQKMAKVEGKLDTVFEDVFVFSNDYEHIYAYLVNYKLDRDNSEAPHWDIIDLPNGLKGVRIPKGDYIPTDLKTTMANVGLNGDELDVLNKRICKDMTLEEVGQCKNLSRERVRQIQAKALSKLYKNFVNLTGGAMLQNKISEMKESAEKDAKEYLKEHYKEQYNIEIASEEFKYRDAMKLIMRKSIRTLDLPTRAVGCMTRAKIKTIEDLMKLSVEDIKNLRNAGNRTVNDIATALDNKYGLTLKHRNGEPYIIE